jgi:hypothetical protein
LDVLQEILARAHIGEVKARYCRFLDTKQWADFAALFTTDATLDLRDDTGAEPFNGRAAITETLRHIVEHAQTSHHVHSPEITFDGLDAADVIWAMQDRVVWEPGKSPMPDATAFTGYGYYHERYVRQDGVWLIAAVRLTRLTVEFQG